MSRKVDKEIDKMLENDILYNSNILSILQEKDKSIKSIDIINTVRGKYLSIECDGTYRYLAIKVPNKISDVSMTVKGLEQIAMNCRGVEYVVLLKDIVYCSVVSSVYRIKLKGTYDVCIGEKTHKLTYVYLPDGKKGLIGNLLCKLVGTQEYEKKYTVVHPLTYNLLTDSGVITEKLIAKLK